MPTVRFTLETSFTLVAALTLIAVAAGCDVVSADGWLYQPFEGPGLSEEGGVDTGLPADHRYVVATTYLEVKPESQQLFQERADAVFAYLDEGPEGLVGYSAALKIGGSQYRTLTVWESYEAMYAFVVSDPHTAAMNEVTEIAGGGDAAQVASWEATDDELPPAWPDVIERLDEEGRSAY